MTASFLKSRQTRYTAYAGTYIVVILAVLGAINFLANRYDKSYDPTTLMVWSERLNCLLLVES